MRSNSGDRAAGAAHHSACGELLYTEELEYDYSSKQNKPDLPSSIIQVKKNFNPIA